MYGDLKNGFQVKSKRSSVMIVGITFLLKIMNLTKNKKSPPSFGRGGGLNHKCIARHTKDVMFYYAQF